MIPQFFRLAACQANAPYFFCTAEDPNRRNQSKKYSKKSDRISNSPSQFVHWFSILPWGGVLSTSFQLIHDQERDAEKWWWGQSKKKTGGTFCSCLPIWLSLGTSLAVSQFEVLATLDFDLLDELARGALQFQGDLLGCLGLRKKWKIVTQTFNARFCRPSCGTRASSDHRNPSASCRNVSYLVRQRLPYQLCTAPLCGSDVSCMVPPCRMSFLSSDIAPYLCPMVKKKEVGRKGTYLLAHATWTRKWKRITHPRCAKPPWFLDYNIFSFLRKRRMMFLHSNQQLFRLAPLKSQVWRKSERGKWGGNYAAGKEQGTGYDELARQDDLLLGKKCIIIFKLPDGNEHLHNEVCKGWLREENMVHSSSEWVTLLIGWSAWWRRSTTSLITPMYVSYFLEN